MTSTKPLRGASTLTSSRIGHELDALAHREHARIFEALIGVAVLETDRAVDERDRDDVLDIDVRHRAVVDDARAVGGQPQQNAPHVVFVQAVLRRATSRNAASGAWIG